MEPAAEAEDKWVATVNEAAKLALMPQADSWYMGANIPASRRSSCHSSTASRSVGNGSNIRFIALRSHYRFDSFYCIPDIDGAHEKGGVKGEIGRFRRTCRPSRSQ